MEKQDLGKFGEQAAAQLLTQKGYVIKEMNYRCRVGEVDIISENAEYIVFAEVKLRKNADFGEAREFVTRSKQEKVRKAAMYYLSKKNTELQPRFDVIEIYAPSGKDGKIEINHLEDAFY